MSNSPRHGATSPLPQIISPSLLAADFARLGEEAAAAVAAGGEWIHCDVMDHHYVPNLTMGPMVCQALRDYGVSAPLDVHLMVRPVDALIDRFAAAGASLISFHPDASPDCRESLRRIRAHGCQAGLALSPGVSPDSVSGMLDMLDLALVMSVQPGFGGQSFMPETLDSLRALRRMIDASGRAIRLEIDGGVNRDNIGAIARAGADTFVVGTAVFGDADYAANIAALRAAARAGAQTR